MNIQRLIKLADHLDTIEALPVDERVRKFDLRSWMVGQTKDSCGTAACAVGEACCAIPEFQAAGLGYDYWNGNPTYQPPGTAIEYGNWSAVQEFFGIGYNIAEYLFSFHTTKEYDEQSDSFSSNYNVADPSPSMVSTRIRNLVKDGL